MKKFLLLLFNLSLILTAKSQLINVNPDPNGEPWYIGTLRIPSEAEINSIKTVENIKRSEYKELPTSLDNSELSFFRPIFNQNGGSCAQASGIAYNFTYEMCRERNVDASEEENQFPSHFTYNFLNRGSGEYGSWYNDGWDIISEVGCPSVEDYGGIWMSNDYYSNLWVSGYNIYENGMQNRVKEYFAIDVSTSEGLQTLKHWMYDHLEDEQTGGIVNFSAGISVEGYNMNGNYIITSWGTPVNHAMTIVGWDDEIEYDFNGDNQITNNIDINGDDIIDMRDWEQGAVIMVNSWGYSWGNMGKAYIPYRLLAESLENGGINNNKVFSINVKETYSPLLVLNAKINHESRNRISIKAGVSTDLNANEPDYIMDFPIFNFQGGDLTMNGSNSNPLELALDITPLLSYFDSNQEVKLFLGVVEIDEYNYYDGKIWEFSVKDFQTEEEFLSESTNINIQNYTTTWISVNASLTFDAPQITTDYLEPAVPNSEYSQQIEAEGGEAPYEFSLLIDYEEETIDNSYPDIYSTEIIPSHNDDGIATINLEFDFPFYGKYYSELYVSTDGSILFDPEFAYLRSEQQIIGKRMIAVYAADLMYFEEENDAIYFESNSDFAVIRWKSSLFDEIYVDVDAAVKLYPSGEIEIFYGDDVTDGLSWVAGISNGDKMNYQFYSNSGIGTPENSQFKFVHQDFPFGIELTHEGELTGSVDFTEGEWNLDVVVIDSKKISKVKELMFYMLGGNICDNMYNEVKCYPNPAKEIINFEFSNDIKGSATIEILDISGRIILTQQIKDNENMINISSLNSGIYIYKCLSNDGEIAKGKFVKQ